jgi:hypothetical protein
VKPEAGHFLAKAHKLLDEADGMLAMKYYDAVGRTAYLAGFRAAQAFIFEQNGRAAKTTTESTLSFSVSPNTLAPSIQNCARFSRRPTT